MDTKFPVEHLLVDRKKIYSNGPGNMTKMAPMPLSDKTPLKIFFSKISRHITLQTCYTALGTWTLQCLVKWWSWVDLDLLYGNVNLASWVCLRKCLNIRIYRNFCYLWLKVGTNSWLSEYMNRFEYQRSRSVFGLCPLSCRLILSSICSQAAKEIKVKLHAKPLSSGVRICSTYLCHMTKMADMPIYG